MNMIEEAMLFGVLAGAIVLGAVLAIATLPLVLPWVHWMHDARG